MLLSNTKIKLLNDNVQQFKMLILVSISLVSCSFKQNAIAIKDINAKKSEKVVRVEGTVKKIVPLISNGSYELQDNTGSIWVITSSNLPIVGTEITIRGKVQQKDITVEAKNLSEFYLVELQKLPQTSKTE